MSNAIELRQLVKTYSVGFVRKKTVRALQGVDLDVADGQIFGLLGPNGAGKSTIIKLLLGLLHPTAGNVSVFGASPTQALTRRNIGYLPENPAPYEYLTGYEFVTLSARLLGLSGAELEANVERAIDTVGMKTAGRLQIRRYSKGMVQRVCLAQALVGKPRLLVLDEPTSGLDVLGRQLVREIIMQQRALGTTVLLCSHIIPDVEVLCDHVAVIVGGKILRVGGVSEMLTTDATLVEIQAEQVPDAALATLGPLLKEQQVVGARASLKCQEGDAPHVLRQLLESGARIIALQRCKYSLEEMFLKAIQEGGRKVGSEIL